MSQARFVFFRGLIQISNEQREDSLYLQLNVQSGCSVRRLFSTVSRPMDNADPRPTNCQRTKKNNSRTDIS